MKKTKFNEEKIAYILRQAEAGQPALEVCREQGISEQTFYRCKKYGGMSVAELRRLRQLEEENHNLKQRMNLNVGACVSVSSRGSFSLGMNCSKLARGLRDE